MEIERPQFLTQQQAEKRASQLKQGTIHYKLHLRYNKGENYEGYVQIQFETTQQFQSSDELLLDYSGKTEGIQSVYINDKKLPSVNHDGLFIHIQGSELKQQQQNQIFIYFKNHYAHDGNGLHSFEDSDKKQYLYSQCEAFFCNKIFPLFDQPDLKTTLTLDVDAPADWTVLFNTNEESGKKIQENQIDFQSYQSDIESFNKETPSDYTHHSFPKTLPLPTYLFGFIAGPFNKIENPNKNFKVPMNLYCRDSLYTHLLKISEFIFEVTEKCMYVYEDYFGYKFAFPKYDQIFCPEFNCGAMENAGLVTFNDLYVFKEEVDATRLTNFSNTITHELAHHWFGNLVTMKWWNDLWLNESFADFISHFALSKMEIKSKKTADIWAIFNQRKGWGYRADQLITTHPIAGPVANTEEAESIFDGITYAKGAASLRQIMSLMGEDAFSDAMKVYFNKYAFQNATLKEFITTLDEQFKKQNVGFTLQEWEQSWLCTAGLNQCQPVFNPENKDKNAQLTIVQTVALEQHPTLRRHKIQVAFFKENGDIDAQNILLQPQKETVITYDGSQNYKAVLLNYKDQSFIKILLDTHSIEFFKQSLHKVKDLLTRSLVWRAFYDMVRDGNLDSESYIEFFINSIPQEVSDEIISNQFQFVSVALEVMTPRKYQEILAEKLFKFSINYLNSIDSNNTNRIVAVKKQLTAFSKSDESVKVLLQWFRKQHDILNKFELGLETQWAIVSQIFKSKAFTVEEKQAIFEEQAQNDQSDTLKNQRAKCDAYIATPEQREKLWAIYNDKDQKEYSLRTLQNSMAGFNNSNALEELQKYYDLWYNGLENYCLTFSKDQFQSFYGRMFPITDDTQGLLTKLQQLGEKIKGGDCVFLIRLLNESIDDLQRKIKTHACFVANSKLSQADKPNL